MNPAPTNPLRALATLLAGLTLSATLSAQTAPSTAAATAKTNSEVLQLSEFSVSADPNRGYAPSETMTGSRIATKIVDLPYTVNMLT
ncbi:MAG: hypothetical protein CK548_08830, partial [Opitutia bacterium]